MSASAERVVPDTERKNVLQKVRYRFVRMQRILVMQQYQTVLKSTWRYKGRFLQLQVNDAKQIFPRLGIVVGKKQVLRANRRNRIKRCVREYFRLHQHELLPLDYVIRVSCRVVPENLSEAMSEIGRLFQRVKQCNKS